MNEQELRLSCVAIVLAEYDHDDIDYAIECANKLYNFVMYGIEDEDSVVVQLS